MLTEEKCIARIETAKNTKFAWWSGQLQVAEISITWPTAKALGFDKIEHPALTPKLRKDGSKGEGLALTAKLPWPTNAEETITLAEQVFDKDWWIPLRTHCRAKLANQIRTLLNREEAAGGKAAEKKNTYAELAAARDAGEISQEEFDKKVLGMF